MDNPFCPWCGQEMKLSTFGNATYDEWRQTFFYRCPACKAQSPLNGDKDVCRDMALRNSGYIRDKIVDQVTEMQVKYDFKIDRILDMIKAHASAIREIREVIGIGKAQNVHDEDH